MTARERRRRGRPWSHWDAADDQKVVVTDSVNPVLDYPRIAPKLEKDIRQKGCLESPDLTEAAAREIESGIQPIRDQVIQRAQKNARAEGYTGTDVPHIKEALRYVLNEAVVIRDRRRWLCGILSGASFSYLLSTVGQEPQLTLLFVPTLAVFTFSLVVGLASK